MIEPRGRRMARRRHDPLVPGARAGLDGLRKNLNPTRPDGVLSRRPAADMAGESVRRLRELARRYVSEHPPEPTRAEAPKAESRSAPTPRPGSR